MVRKKHKLLVVVCPWPCWDAEGFVGTAAVRELVVVVVVVKVSAWLLDP